jgi:predicted Zn-dependent protease
MSSMEKLKKKLKMLVAGCGCATLLAVIVGVVLFGSATGVIGWLSGAARNIGVNVPKEITLPSLPKELGLPQSIKVPQLPVNPFRLSQQEQIALGNEVAAKQGLDKGVFADPKIKEISARLVKALPSNYRGPKDQGWDWRFRALRTKKGEVNAIALPGGRVYVYDGLMKLTGGDPDQLAAIIGHEMAHVVEEHSAKQLRNAGLLKKASGLLVGSSGSEAGGGNPQAEAVKVWAAQVGDQLTKMRLSQSAEYQADDLGFRFMSAAGYDPRAGLEVMRKLGKLSGKPKSMLSGVFSTHPPPDKRIQRLQKNMAGYQRMGKGQ